MIVIEPHIDLSSESQLAPAVSPLHWFALKAFGKGMSEVQTLLKEWNVETYFPCEDIWVEHADGTRHHKHRPLIHSLLFFRATYKQVTTLRHECHGKVMIYTRRMGYKVLPYVIPDREMNVFMLVTSAGDRGVELVDLQFDFSQGEHVRVIDGPFKGAEGYICRIKKNRRLVVCLEGVCAVATSYIPREFLQRI